MQHRISIPLAALALLVLSGCGGGGGSTPAIDDAGLNSYEKQLVGSYELTGFELYEFGVQPYYPTDFETWNGALVLQDDRMATLTLRLCQHGDTITRSCDRAFAWSADAGVLRLDPVEPGVAGSMGAWTMDSGQVLHLEMLQPTNEPDCSLFVLPDGGSEDYTWQRQP